MLVWDATSIGRYMNKKIAPQVQGDIKAALKKAAFVGGAVDESVVARRTRPMFLNLQMITSLFQWMHLNAGQINSVNYPTGAAAAVGLNDMLKAVGLTIDDVHSFGTDGCYAMRSNIAGVEGRDGGDSMIAAIKIVATNPLLAFHCLIHIDQLAIRHAIKVALPKFWERHIRSMYTWGARSVKRLHEFSKAHQAALAATASLLLVFQRVRETHSWEWTYFDRYVVTRWESALKCIRSSLINWPGARGVSNIQREEGWGPKYYNANAVDNQDATADVEDDDEEWEELLAMSNFDVGDVNAPRSKRSPLLCPRTGVTDVNWGLNAGMYVVLKPVQEVNKLLQTTKAPIQHFAARHVNTIMDHLQDIVAGDWKDNGVYSPFVKFCTAQNRLELLQAINEVIEQFAAAFLENFTERVEPYMRYYKAMELIDPTSVVASQVLPHYPTHIPHTLNHPHTHPNTQ